MAPSLSKALAVAKPIPAVDPVIKTVFSFNSKSILYIVS
jgi:hypothetical protein